MFRSCMDEGSSMKRLMLAVAVVGLSAAPGMAQDKPVGNAETDQAAAAIIADCSARKFETSIELVQDGKPRKSKVKLCGKQGQTDAEWAHTLKDAVAKIEANQKMPQAGKDQLVTALKAEIAKFEPVSAPSVALPAVLPPVANAPAKPRVTIKCLAPGDKGTGTACLSLDRTTQLFIRADEDLGGGVGLRFLRRGGERGKIDLAQMRQGQIMRSRLPPELCAGVASSQVQIQVMGSDGITDTLGPYKLTC